MSNSPTIELDRLKKALDTAGLTLCSVFSASQLEDVWQDSINWKSLLLIGNAGRQMWDSMPPSYFDRQDPIDEYSAEVVSQLVSDQLSPQHWQLLFPTDANQAITLQDLGAQAGWHKPSPLGIGINHDNGLWFAYRAVVALDAEVIGGQPNGAESARRESPCLSCEDTPCVTACPAGALELMQSPVLSSCVEYRVQAESTCGSTCVARLACPVAAEFRYSDEQIAYYYDRSLESVKRWVSAG